MLIVNWKKHYHVPGLFFNDIRYTSSRKGKFYYLSDLVFRIIHKFCLKLCLYYYVRYLFYYRFQKMCLNLNNNFSSKTLLNNINYILTNTHSIYNSYSNTFILLSRSINNKKKWVIDFNFFTSIIRFFINKTINKTAFLISCFLIYENKILTWIFKFFFNSILNKLIKVKSIIFNKYNSKNIFFLLYQITIIKSIIKDLMFFLYSLINLITIYKSYVKQSPFLNRIDTKSWYDAFFSTYDLYKSKNFSLINTSWKKNYSLYINYVSHSFHNIFSHFFFLRKLNLYKSLKFINYINTNSLIYKKEIIYTFRKQFRLFRNKFRKYRLRYVYRFYIFLIRIFYAKKNWLLGPVHKVKFFKYIFMIYNKLKLTFKSLFSFNNSSVKKKEQLSFFFDSPKIREHFFLYLGKKRYSEEFLLLKNKKWYFKFYIKHFYNIDLKFLLQYYKELRKKFNIVQIKDLFVFIEHNIIVFSNKYLNLFHLNNSNLIINGMNFTQKKFFFIGDFLKINHFLFNKYMYEKFYIFFYLIFFINPIFLVIKSRLLNSLYISLYDYILNGVTFLSNMNSKISFFDSINISIKKIIFYISSWLSKYKYNDYIKTLHLIFNKFNIQLSDDKLGNYNFIKNHLMNNEISSFFSINKVFVKFNLIKFNLIHHTYKKRIVKPFWWFKNIKFDKSFWRRKKRNRISKNFFINFYKYYKYNFLNATTNAKKKVYYNNIYTKLNQKNYKYYLSKKFFFFNNNRLSSLL